LSINLVSAQSNIKVAFKVKVLSICSLQEQHEEQVFFLSILSKQYFIHFLKKKYSNINHGILIFSIKLSLQHTFDSNLCLQALIQTCTCDQFNRSFIFRWTKII